MAIEEVVRLSTTEDSFEEDSGDVLWMEFFAAAKLSMDVTSIACCQVSSGNLLDTQYSGLYATSVLVLFPSV